MSRAVTERRALLLAMLAVLPLAAPLFFGSGIDIPDDALYSTVAGWESFRARVWGSGPFFWITDRLGGTSMYSEAMQMGPFYPAMWTAALLPVPLALPVAYLLHALGTLLAVRWAARTFGVSAVPATLAGAAVVIGPLGSALWIEAQTDTAPIYLWFPVIIGCMRKVELAGERRVRAGWAALAGAALGAMLLGAHLRHNAGACGALGLWFLLRFRTLPWAVLATAIGLSLGAPAWLPGALEWREAASIRSLMPEMSVPPYQRLQWTALASWIAPKNVVTAREFGAGAVLGLAFFAGLRRRRDGVVVLLAAWTGLLLLAAADLQVPGLRLLWLPLSLLAHPVTIIYYALAMIPAAIVGAAGLDRLLAGSGPSNRKLLRGPFGAAAVVLSAAVAARVAIGWADPERAVLASPYEWTLYLVGAIQAAAVTGALLHLLLRDGDRARRARLVFLVALLDLVVISIRFHTAVPSRSLELWRRARVEDAELLAGGYLELREAAALLDDGMDFIEHMQTQAATGAGLEGDFEMGGELELLEEEGPALQDDLVDRRWPVHVGAALGVRSLSGRAKLPPARAVEALLPLARELAPPWDPEEGPPPGLEDYRTDLDEAKIRALFGEGGLGARTLALHGIPIAVGELGSFPVDPVAPRCYSPTRFEVVPEPEPRVGRLLSRDFDPEGVALLDEQSVAPDAAFARAETSCDPEGWAVTARADGPAVVVLRERFHSGWSVEDEDGGRYEPFPVNHVHLGVQVPPGSRTLRFSFLPPGLPAAGAGFALGLLAVLGLTGRAGLLGRPRRLRGDPRTPEDAEGRASG